MTTRLSCTEGSPSMINNHSFPPRLMAPNWCLLILAKQAAQLSLTSAPVSSLPQYFRGAMEISLLQSQHFPCCSFFVCPSPLHSTALRSSWILLSTPCCLWSCREHHHHCLPLAGLGQHLGILLTCSPRNRADPAGSLSPPSHRVGSP